MYTLKEVAEKLSVNYSLLRRYSSHEKFPAYLASAGKKGLVRVYDHVQVARYLNARAHTHCHQCGAKGVFDHKDNTPLCIECYKK